jgi:general secretion pathway protein N
MERQLGAAPARQHGEGAVSTRRWAWTGAFVGAVLALVSQAPAYWVTQLVAQASGERVLLQDAQGTVWQGSAQAVLSAGPQANASNTALPTRLQWQLGPQLDVAAAQFGLRLSLSSACCTTQPLSVDVTPQWRGVRVQVNDQRSTWPASWLTGLGAPWNTLQAEGALQLSTQQLAWQHIAGQAQFQGQAQLQLQQLSTRLSTLKPLGSYRVVLQGMEAGATATQAGDTMRLTLDTLEGSLQLQGTGQWRNGRLQFSGEASSEPDAQAALSNLLNILGQRQGAKSILKLG